jgi:hypothetical protein
MVRIPGLSRAQVEAAIADAEQSRSLLWRTGHVYDSNWQTAGGSMAGTAMTANILYGMPIFIPAGSALTNIGINVTVAGAASTKARLGLSSINDDLTGTLVADAGEVAVDATGSPELAFTPDVSAGGWYYLNITSNGAPTIMAHISSAAAPLGRSSYSSTVRIGSAYVSRTYAALPDTFSPTSFGTAMYAVGLKAA